ncbi:conserved exported hypothetical protein [metagenome]
MPIVSGVALVVLLVAVFTMSSLPLTEKQTSITQKPITDKISYPITFSYNVTNSNIISILASKGISMSNPLKFSGNATAQYCTFYQDDIKQNSVEYCTSTELKDSDGKFLGNIHITGSVDSPNAILGVIQTDPFMNQLDSIKTVYQTMVESVVCDCWQEQKPGNLESVSAWIDAAKSHHLEGKHTTSNSQIDGLAQKHLFLEITTNTKGYLWKFVITN